MRIGIIIILFQTFGWRLPRRYAPRNDSESTPCDDRWLLFNKLQFVPRVADHT